MNSHQLIKEIAILAPPFLFALTTHEFAHGYVANRLGDPTALRAGRLTLNPLKHLDPIGVICFIIMKIGWAKPVPVNPGYFKKPKNDMLLVSLAGPGINILLAIVSAIILKVALLGDQLIPLFLLQPFVNMLAASIWINIMLAVFNFLPIPPLDGSKIFMGLLPRRLAAYYTRFEPFGFILLLVLFYTGMISKIILPIISFAQNLLCGA